MRVDATVNELLEPYLDPFEPQEATALADREGIVVRQAECAPLRLVLVMIDGMPWGFVPGYLAHVDPVDGADKQPAMKGEGVAPAFDPYREPLSMGDTVQGMDGRIGHVTRAERRRLGVVFEGGSAWCGDLVWRCSFRIIRKAGDCGQDGCPF